MPEYLRSLIVILALVIPLFSFAKHPALAIITEKDFNRRRNLWLALTLIAFLANNFWIYVAIAILLLLRAKKQETNPTALFFFVLFALPMAKLPIPGGGVINYLFDLSHARLLALIILLPLYLAITRQSSTLPFGRTSAEKFLIAYLALSVVLHLRDSTITGPATVTDTLRETFYLFLDIFLPYFVISRSLKTLQEYKDALMSLVVAIMIVAIIAVFEFLKNWLLYHALIESLSLQGGMTKYLGRDNMLRVTSAAGQPIPLGYLLTVGIGFYLFLQRSFKQKLTRRLGLLLLIAGLIAPLSRGPWIGAVVLLLIFVASGRKPTAKLLGLVMAGVLSLTLLAALPGGERVINLLPFIGTTEKENVDFRENLIANSLIVIQRNLWFGSVDFLNNPEMESMRAGGDGGIIDVVNSYIGIALEQGIVGLFLFVSFFALILLGVLRALRRIPDKNSETHLLGRSLLATLCAILVIIFTVSSITIIPIVYWSVAGLCAGYTRMILRPIQHPAPRNVTPEPPRA